MSDDPNVPLYPGDDAVEWITETSGGVSEPNFTHLPMVCIHGDEGRAAAEATRAEVLDLLHGHAGTQASPLTGWLGALIYSLNSEFDATEVSIASDMWCLVSADVGYGEDVERVVVACDFPEDGLFAIWKLLNDRAVSSVPTEERQQ